MTLRICMMLFLALNLSAQELKFTVKKLRADNNEACAIADYNNDGVLDVSAGEYWYAGPDYKPQKLRTLGSFGKDYMTNNGEFAFDVDKDGWMDIIAGEFLKDEVHWYKNPGKDGLAAGTMWEQKLFTKTAKQNEIAYLRDFDGDGKPEYVANSWNAGKPQLLWRFQFQKETPTMSKSMIGKKNGHGIGFGDVNGDGREDILFLQGWYERPAEDIFSKQWKYHADWNLKKHASCPIIVTDLNKDGRNDLIWGQAHNYGLYWEEQLPPKDGKTQWKRHEIDKSISQFHALAWVDLDGDGHKDIITGKRFNAHSGKDPGAKDPYGLYYYKFDSKALTFSKHLIAENVGTGLFIQTADLNKDGLNDVVVAGKSGTYIIFSKK
jgi:hypothetical protein